MAERSGLTGRGGAGFPTGRKMRSVAARRGKAVVVANGAEGEPASCKDRLLLTRVPHLVLDGIALAAYAVGADEAHLVVHGQEADLMASLEHAIADRETLGVDQAPIQLTGIPARYVSSEQSSIVQYLSGGPARPTFSPPRPHERGVKGRPTLVNNVETLAHLALIARYGDGWFRSVGPPSAPGSTLVTVGGAVARPGVYEIEMGTPVGQVVMMAGGPSERLQALLVGGYFGAWLPAELAWQVPMTARRPARRWRGDGRWHGDRAADHRMRAGRDGPGGQLPGRGERRPVRPLHVRAAPRWPIASSSWLIRVDGAGPSRRSPPSSR